MTTKNRLCMFFPIFILSVGLFTVGCTRTNAEKATEEIPFPAIGENSSSTEVSAVEFTAVRYVTARDGLIMRETPSTSSNRLGIRLYGARISISKRSVFPETIGGMTAYWYRGNGFNGIPDDRVRDFWLFGGFLSPEIPDDVSPLLGHWNTDRGEWFVWDFWPNNTGSFSIRNGHGILFNWTLIEDTLTLISIPTYEFEESETMVAIVFVDNLSQISFTFVEGRLEGREILDRSNDIFY